MRSTFKLDVPIDVVADAGDDDRLLKSLQHPAVKASFHWVKDDADLRQIIEAGNFGAWRLYLHPEQRKYVDTDYKGAFRLSGGAGTGKTVVAVHRARRLAASNPGARVLLTTYTRNLAEDLSASLLRLDDQLAPQQHLGESGVIVRGIDAVAWAVVQRAGDSIEPAVAEVLGEGRKSVLGGSRPGLWKEAIEEVRADLPAELRTEAFLETEYALVILPNRISSETEYVRVRRAGRGVALDRPKRKALWKVVDRYRSKARIDGTTDFDEKAAIAAAWLEHNGPLFDHVIVDEAQDLTPSRLRLLRRLAAEGPNDLFICEDSHQRIYGQKVTLSHVGINIRGRSRRLTLNYRTTAENLRWAMGILSGGTFTDMEGDQEEHGYRSARTGPVPELI
ncbi:UvrD-helicase domain-containing protein [Arsenicicoccus bolidensis]|uniref:UvrD-helicase domain-containing protein n=1 Tax=Arsenicicoccus bolidensis TaxID=229480 RepID=A0ABS9PZ07_9MICO|nr:UvrD-helicase domain-containing protein [Arsenicicoccus bolidensis]MCG7320842.1 UvrD-helicase domain-containing protein [Arsenicicoccus bolidensis]